jgi:hypothetical protein
MQILAGIIKKTERLVIKIRLGEAILQLSELEGRLERLGARLTQDTAEARPVSHVISEIEATANRMRDLKGAIEWSRQQLAVGGVPLGTYSLRKEMLLKVADLLYEAEGPDYRAKIDELVAAASDTETIIQTINWSVDLQIPNLETTADEDISEEEK